MPQSQFACEAVLGSSGRSTCGARSTWGARAGIDVGFRLCDHFECALMFAFASPCATVAGGVFFSAVAHAVVFFAVRLALVSCKPFLGCPLLSQAALLAAGVETTISSELL